MRVEFNARGKCKNESVNVVINEVPVLLFKRLRLTVDSEKSQGLQTEGREGVCKFIALLRSCVFEGVTG
jgi:hypothetical protein